MANKVFSSYRACNNKDAAANQTLIVEVSHSHIACMVKSGGGKETVKDLELYSFEKDAPTDFTKFFSDVLEDSELLRHSYRETQVFVNNDVSLLAPSQGFTKDSMNNYLNVVYGERRGEEVFVDSLPEEGINNVFRIPTVWVEELNKRLHFAFIKHTYSKVIDEVLHKAASIDGNLLKVVFYQHHIILLLITQKRLNIVQSFAYQNHDDVLYHLLNTSQRFNLAEKSLHLQLSGMIDIKSGLLGELKQYFKRVTLEEVDTKVAQINMGEYSKHYFTPFINLAK